MEGSTGCIQMSLEIFKCVKDGEKGFFATFLAAKVAAQQATIWLCVCVFLSEMAICEISIHVYYNVCPL